LQDETGNPVSLKEGAEIEVTIEAEPEQRRPRNSQRRKNPLDELWNGTRKPLAEVSV
jgi:hypothetical protein